MPILAKGAGVADLVCSLKYDPAVDGAQSIPADGAYHLVRFPYGSHESYDPDNMHALTRNGKDHPFSNQQSGLIWPALPPGKSAWAHLFAMVQWKPGNATEYRDRFVRDPLNLSSGTDSTCTEHRAPSPGMQCFAKSWAMWVSPETPIGLMVAHNAASSMQLDVCEFKLSFRA